MNLSTIRIYFNKAICSVIWCQGQSLSSGDHLTSRVSYRYHDATAHVKHGVRTHRVIVMDTRDQLLVSTYEMEETDASDPSNCHCSI